MFAAGFFMLIFSRIAGKDKEPAHKWKEKVKIFSFDSKITSFGSKMCRKGEFCVKCAYIQRRRSYHV